ncbi:hypothetical protein [Sphingomonas sp.]|uniref:hypothetical protein n=1 Tax=Sphingomonas sp. TaxID=28214 RepID=UPI002ED90D3D
MNLTLMLGTALLVPVTTFAQTAPAAPAAPADAAKAAAKFNLDTPIGELLANEAAKAVLDKELPGLTQLPQLEMIKGLSLRQLQPYSDGKLTDELLAKTETGLAAIK